MLTQMSWDRRWSTENAVPTGPAAVAIDWANLGALLATVIAAHRPSLPDEAARDALDAAVASLLDATAIGSLTARQVATWTTTILI